jgi:hypothetical protein
MRLAIKSTNNRKYGFQPQAVMTGEFAIFASHFTLMLFLFFLHTESQHIPFCYISPINKAEIRPHERSDYIPRKCIQKFPDWPPEARTANGTALCH